MARKKGGAPGAEATVGYATDQSGNGVAYARLGGAAARQVLRVGFRVSTRPLSERAIGYAALTAVTRALSRRGVRNVRFIVCDGQFADELATGCGVADHLVLSYVGLRCALNSLDACGIRTGDTDELTQRARAEVTLNVAA